MTLVSPSIATLTCESCEAEVARKEIYFPGCSSSFQVCDRCAAIAIPATRNPDTGLEMITCLTNHPLDVCVR